MDSDIAVTAVAVTTTPPAGAAGYVAHGSAAPATVTKAAVAAAVLAAAGYLVYRANQKSRSQKDGTPKPHPTAFTESAVSDGVTADAAPTVTTCLPGSMLCAAKAAGGGKHLDFREMDLASLPTEIRDLTHLTDLVRTPL